MRYGIALILSTALAALSSVICSYFANDPSTGLSHFQATFDNEFIT